MALAPDAAKSAIPASIEDDRPPVDAPGLQYFVFGLFFIFGGIIFFTNECNAVTREAVGSFTGGRRTELFCGIVISEISETLKRFV